VFSDLVGFDIPGDGHRETVKRKFVFDSPTAALGKFKHRCVAGLPVESNARYPTHSAPRGTPDTRSSSCVVATRPLMATICASDPIAPHCGNQILLCNSADVFVMQSVYNEGCLTIGRTYVESNFVLAAIKTSEHFLGAEALQHRGKSLKFAGQHARRRIRNALSRDGNRTLAVMCYWAISMMSVYAGVIGIVKLPQIFI
jgi:hypothetical protein